MRSRRWWAACRERPLASAAPARAAALQARQHTRQHTTHSSTHNTLVNAQHTRQHTTHSSTHNTRVNTQLTRQHTTHSSTHNTCATRYCKNYNVHWQSLFNIIDEKVFSLIQQLYYNCSIFIYSCSAFVVSIRSLNDFFQGCLN